MARAFFLEVLKGDVIIKCLFGVMENVYFSFQVAAMALKFTMKLLFSFHGRFAPI